MSPARSCARHGGWPLERVLFAMAGTVTLLSALLAAVVSPWFLLLTAFVGVNQWLYVLVGACPASLVLGRLFGLRSTLYPPGDPAMTPRYGPIGRLGRYTATHFRDRRDRAGRSSPSALGFFAPRVETALSGAGWEATGSESVAARKADRQELPRPVLERSDGRRALARQDGERPGLPAGARRDADGRCRPTAA